MDTARLEKLSPHDSDIEKATLGAMISSREARGKILSMLKEGDFYKSSHQEVFRAIKGMESSGEDIDALTLVGHLKSTGKLDDIGGKIYIHSIISEVTTSAMGISYAKKVKEFNTLRDLMKAASDIYTRARDGGREDTDTVLSWAREKILSVTTQTEKNLVEMSDYSQEFMEVLKKKKQIEIPTGFAALDKALGGLERGRLYVLASRTSVGKSSLAVNIMINTLKDGTKCLLFSLEESWEDIYRKMASIELEIDSQALSRGYEDKIDGFAKRLKNWPLLYYPHMNASIEKIMEYSCQIKDLDLVVVDYIQLVESSVGDTREQKIGMVARGLKRLSAEANVAVLALSQFNRRAEEAKPALSDLRDSGAIEQDADVVMSLERYGDYDYIKKCGEMKLSILKNRYGPLGRMLLTFNGSCTKFYEKKRLSKIS